MNNAGVEWSGVIAGAVLPLTDAGAIDWDSLERHLENLCSAELSGVVVNADTGEGPLLLPEERDAVLRFAVRSLRGRLPVLSGLVAVTEQEGVAAARRAEELGASGLQVFLPESFGSANAAAYYEALGAACSLPLVVYQSPAALGTAFEPEVLRQVLALEAVVGVKESSWDPGRFAETERLCQETKPRAVLLSGADTFILESLRMGADGAMLAVAAIDPQLYVELSRRRETVDADALQRALDPFLGVLLAPPIGDFRARLKEVLRLDGIIRSSAVRPPLRPVAPAEIGRLRDVLERARADAADCLGALSGLELDALGGS